MIARSASGSFRDALGTLDQLVAFGGNEVGLDEVLEMLGAADAELLFDAVDAVVAEDPKAVLLGVEKMARSGRDPSQFARDLLAHLRFLLVTQTTGEVPTSFVVTATDSARLQSQAAAVGPATLIRTDRRAGGGADRCARGRRRAHGGGDRAAESGAAGLGSVYRGTAAQDRATRGTASDGVIGPRVLSGQGTLRVQSRKRNRRSLRSPSAPVDAEVDKPEPEQEEPVAQGELDLEKLKQVWPAVLDQLATTAPALAAFFEDARPVGLEGDVVEVSFPAGATFNKRKAETPENRERVAESLQTVTGQALKPTYVLLDGESEAPLRPRRPRRRPRTRHLTRKSCWSG